MMEKMACNIEAARIVSLPAEAYYIGDFISEDEEASLLQKVSIICDEPASTTGNVCIAHQVTSQLISDTSMHPSRLISCTNTFLGNIGASTTLDTSITSETSDMAVVTDEE